MWLYIPLLLRLIANTEEKIREDYNNEEKHMWIVFVTYAIMIYIISLHGNKGVLLDLIGLNESWNRNNKSCFIISLLGKIK